VLGCLMELAVQFRSTIYEMVERLTNSAQEKKIGCPILIYQVTWHWLRNTVLFDGIGREWFFGLQHRLLFD
jgi:hypothetical protein